MPSEFQIDCYRLSAYEGGYAEGRDDALDDLVRSQENLVQYFDCLIKCNVFKNHEKQQFLIAYRRGATGLPR
jgi:hypothetical protein